MDENATASADVEIPDPVLGAGGLPDITSETGALDTNARLVWCLVRYTELETPLKAAQHEGEDGYLWRGALSRVLVETWPMLREPSVVCQSIRMRVNQYLKLTHNLVCLDRGSYKQGGRNGKNRTPVWWVRADWSDKKDLYKVTTIWPRLDEEAQEDPETVGERIPETPDPKVYTCDYPGCTAGSDGAPFTSHRANVIPMHRRVHVNRDTVLEAAARLVAQSGTDAAKVTVQDVADLSGLHASTVYNLFTTSGALFDQARELLAERGAAGFAPLPGPAVEPPPVVQATDPVDAVDPDPVTLDEWYERMLRLAAFADVNGTPLAFHVLQYSASKALPGHLRDALLERLETGGDLITRYESTSSGHGRNRKICTVADPLSHLADLEIISSNSGTASGTEVDYAAALRALLADYETQDARIASQQAVIATQRQEAESQNVKITEARTELAELRMLIAPLMNHVGNGQT
jgi:AcrR family transcriptional regulator